MKSRLAKLQIQLVFVVALFCQYESFLLPSPTLFLPSLNQPPVLGSMTRHRRNSYHFLKWQLSVSTSPSSSSSFETSKTQRRQYITDNNDGNSNHNTLYNSESIDTNNNDSGATLSRKEIRTLFSKAKTLERKGQWRKAIHLLDIILQHDPTDSHSHLALARLEARRQPPLLPHRHRSYQNSDSNVDTNDNNDDIIHKDSNCINNRAREAFRRGVDACPTSVHLLQAWAIYEQKCTNYSLARQLFGKALTLQPSNPYVCHAYGLMERQLQNDNAAYALWNTALDRVSTAALVCQMGELLISRQQLTEARDLYSKHVLKLANVREKTEVYLANAWLEEQYFGDVDRAEQLIRLALALNPSSSMAQIALARLEGRHRHQQRGEEPRTVTVRRLARTCINTENNNANSNDDSKSRATSKSRPEDGRVYNAWARIEVQARRYSSARKILSKGIDLYPQDYNLLQAAGKLEERMGNFTGARDLYSASLCIQPSTPALVAYALLEFRCPEDGYHDFEKVQQLFEESLLLNPRHGPAYNSYGNTELRRGNIEAARRIFQRGIAANCYDVASVYHGYARLELSLGNVQEARELLQKGRREARRMGSYTDSPSRDRASYLTHTLGMLELNSNRPRDALDAFMEGIRRYGNSSQLLLGAALSQVKLGNENKARSFFEQSVHSDEKHAQAWQAWGIMEMRAGNWNTAKTLFECGTKNAPKHGALWTAFAIAEGRLGNVTEARSLFVKGIKNAPNHAPLYQAWASLEVKEKNYDAAKTLISLALTKDKTHASGWLVAADIEYQLGNRGVVGLILRRGIECAPTSVSLYKALGDHLLGEGKVNEAREIYEQGIEKDPLYAPLYHSLAELEARIFNVEGLSRLNKKAAQFFSPSALVSSKNKIDEAWGMRIKANRNKSIPEGVAALAERIVDDRTNEVKDVDVQAFISTINDNLLEQGLVGELLSLETDV